MPEKNKQSNDFSPLQQKVDKLSLSDLNKLIEELIVSTGADPSIDRNERERREAILGTISKRIQQDGIHRTRSYPDRARQFMPFAALKGYHELARTREKVSEPKHVMTEERAVKLSETLSGLSKGSMVAVTHYEKDQYVTTCGVVTKIDEAYRILTVVKQQIKFDTIYLIETIN